MENRNIHTEVELFALIAEGDERAFNELYFQLQPVLIGFIVKLMKSDDAVMEIIQESLLRFWLQRDKIPEIRYPRSYLFRIVSNECYRYLRKHGIQQRRVTGLNEQHEASVLSNALEQELSYRETQRFIDETVQSLSPRQREVYRLSRNQGLRIPEIAGELGLSEVYVKKTLLLALSRIRQKLLEAGRYTLPVIFWLLK